MADYVPELSVEEKLEDISPKVAEAIGKITQYAIPYFESVSYGKDISW